jgi:hypothetical protein
MRSSNLSHVEPAGAGRVQITMSPYHGEVDFSAVGRIPRGIEAIDPVSLADLFRNAFVYPPHSIYKNVKIATFGFDPAQDMYASPPFRFDYPGAGKGSTSPDQGDVAAWTAIYHQHLCEAVGEACAGMQAPWLLQSGGKDSTSLAIAVAEARPDTTCVTYLGGREEDEVASARAVAGKLGLRHEVLLCDPGRAYDRYLAMVDRMPLLCADFALLSYADLVTDIAGAGGDGIVDGLGSDIYFGAPADSKLRMRSLLAREMRLPHAIVDSRLVSRSFKLSFALATAQMHAFERFFPGSRFSNAEVDALFGRDIASRSRQRMEAFRRAMESAGSFDDRRAVSIVVVESAASFAKGLYSAEALSLRAAYPFCQARLREWVYREAPPALRVDPKTGVNKVLVRHHIARHFDKLPYVTGKGSFRFDLVGLAAARFDQVRAYAELAGDVLPGAVPWLDRHRSRLDNKYHASKFYLLAIALPWLLSRAGRA